MAIHFRCPHPPNNGVLPEQRPSNSLSWPRRLLPHLKSVATVAVRGPRGGPARQAGRLPVAALQGGLRLPQGQLRQGPQQTRARPQEGPHRGQLTRLLRLPPRQRRSSTLPSPSSPSSSSPHRPRLLLQIPVQSWFDDMSDTELLDLLPILERMVAVENVYAVLRNANEHGPP